MTVLIATKGKTSTESPDRRTKPSDIGEIGGANGKGQRQKQR